MKGTIIFIAIVSVMACLMVYHHQDTALSKKRFEQYEAEFNTRLNKVESELDTLKRNTDTLMRDTDTLKRGQRVIYEEVRKNSEKTLWDLIR